MSFWFLRIYSNESENKNNVASCLWSISDRTNVSTEKIYTSYESLNTQLLWARETRAWHTHGGPTPTSLQKIYIFSFWGHGGHVRLKKWKNNVLYQISLSQDPKNHWVWITLSLNHEKMFVWNVSIWVGGPCTSFKQCLFRTKFVFPIFSFEIRPPTTAKAETTVTVAALCYSKEILKDAKLNVSTIQCGEVATKMTATIHNCPHISDTKYFRYR